MKAVSQQNKDRWQWINCSIGGKKQTLLHSDQIVSPQFWATQCSHTALLSYAGGERKRLLHTGREHCFNPLSPGGPGRGQGIERTGHMGRAPLLLPLSQGHFLSWPHVQVFCPLTLLLAPNSPVVETPSLSP